MCSSIHAISGRAGNCFFIASIVAFNFDGEVLTSRQVDDLVEHCSALAYLSKEQNTLHIRVARDIDGNILVDGINQTYSIGKDGWSKISACRLCAILIHFERDLKAIAWIIRISKQPYRP